MPYFNAITAVGGFLILPVTGCGAGSGPVGGGGAA
jgi:hypothetical protein